MFDVIGIICLVICAVFIIIGFINLIFIISKLPKQILKLRNIKIN